VVALQTVEVLEVLEVEALFLELTLQLRVEQLHLVKALPVELVGVLTLVAVAELVELVRTVESEALTKVESVELL
jgi:hypothetical protein